MSAHAGKHKRSDIEIYRKRRKRRPNLGISAVRHRGKGTETTSLLTLKQKNIEDTRIDIAHLESNEKFTHN